MPKKTVGFFGIISTILFATPIHAATTCDPGYYLDGDVCRDCGNEYFCTGGTAPRVHCSSVVPSGSPAPSTYRSLSNGSWNDYDHAVCSSDCNCQWYFSDETRETYMNQRPCEYGPGGDNYTYYDWCRTGHYATDPLNWNNWYTNCAPCTNAPANAHYTSYSTPSTMYAVESNCPWDCDSGYHKEGGTCVVNTKACSGNLTDATGGNITWNGSAWDYTGCTKSCDGDGIYEGVSNYTESGWTKCRPISSTSGCHWPWYNNNGESCDPCPAGYWCFNQKHVCPAGYFCPANIYDPSYKDYGDLYKCSAGFTSDAGAQARSDCYKSCTRNCTPQTCPANAVCTHGTGTTSGTEYEGVGCDAPATSCPMTVDGCVDGYALGANGACVQICTAGVTKIHAGDVVAPLWAVRQTTPSLVVRVPGGMCYGNLTTATGSGIHVRVGDTTYRLE